VPFTLVTKHVFSRRPLQSRKCTQLVLANMNIFMECLSLCVCVCVCVCVHVCVCVRACCVCVRVYAYMSLVCVCVYVCVRVYAYMSLVCVRVCMCAGVDCVRVRVCVCGCGLYLGRGSSFVAPYVSQMLDQGHCQAVHARSAAGLHTALCVRICL